MLERQLTKIALAVAANLNQAANTALLTFTVTKPVEIRRFGVVADSANGLLAASVLKMRKLPAATGTAADVTGAVLTTGAVVARGFGIYRTLATRVTGVPGDKFTVAVSTDAGGASTGEVFIEYEELPFAGSPIDNMTEKTA